MFDFLQILLKIIHISWQSHESKESNLRNIYVKFTHN